MEPDEWEKMSFIFSLLWLPLPYLVATFVPNTPQNGFAGGQAFIFISVMLGIPVIANLYRVYRSITMAGLGLIGSAVGIAQITGVVRGIIWLIKKQKQPVLRSAQTGSIEGEEDWEKEKSA